MADRNTLDTGTRIAAGDTGINYDSIAITLHWLTAVLVVVQFVLGQTWGWFSRPTHARRTLNAAVSGIVRYLGSASAIARCFRNTGKVCLASAAV